jgi:hypothetical protein
LNNHTQKQPGLVIFREKLSIFVYTYVHYLLIKGYLFMKALLTLTLFSVSIALFACSTSEYEKCKADASQYWDSTATSNSKSSNPKYWAAIEKCKTLDK